MSHALERKLDKAERKLQRSVALLWLVSAITGIYAIAFMQLWAPSLLYFFVGAMFLGFVIILGSRSNVAIIASALTVLYELAVLAGFIYLLICSIADSKSAISAVTEWSNSQRRLTWGYRQFLDHTVVICAVAAGLSIANLLVRVVTVRCAVRVRTRRKALEHAQESAAVIEHQCNTCGQSYAVDLI